MKELQTSDNRWIRRVKHPGLFLTFDDGPNSAVTPRLLDILHEVGASATFFVTGESLNQSEAPAILRRMLAEGHTIGNHGQTHFEYIYPDFEASQQRIESSCGVHTSIFRAPHGSKTHVADYLQRNRKSVGVHWTSHLEDWLPVDLTKVAKQIPEIVVQGSIVLLHDGAPSTDAYRDRSQVVAIVKMIAAECRRKSIPMVGLASIYPALHRIRPRSEWVRDDKCISGRSSITTSIAATLGAFKQWCRLT